MVDFLETDDEKKTLLSLNLDDLSIDELKDYLDELKKEMNKVNNEIEKKNKIKDVAEKYFK